MSLTRRTFLVEGGLAAAFLAGAPALPSSQVPPVLPLCRGGRFLPAAFKVPKGPIRPTLNISTLTPFVDALPIPPIARSTELRPAPDDTGLKLPYYRVSMRPTECQMHRDMKPTRCWSYNGSVPGPTFEARSGHGMLVEWVNDLPRQHFLPIDHRLHGAEADQPEVRTIVHLHGGRTPHDSDGYPESWITPGQSALFHYPLKQDAATLWYHDHAMGINRLNVYAGLFGAFILRDGMEEHLDLPKGDYEVPLLLCDRMFYRDDHQLYYPTSDDLNAPWIPDLEADGLLVNGKLFPYFEVEPRRYRFRVIGSMNGRVFRLSLSNMHPLLQIGTDQGLLPKPVPVQNLLLAPGERADVVIDFSGLAGTHVVLKNDAIEMLQFRVAQASRGASKQVPKTLRPVHRMAAATAVKTRQMTLNEHEDKAGNPVKLLLNETPWEAPVTERPELNTVEIWEFLNLTDDIHPMHLHMVRFQLLDRQVFHPPDYLRTGKVVLLGPVIPPEPAEMGWKDTIQAYPGMITRIIVKFEGYAGRYLWHCHILEHEANDMMRPYEVIETVKA